MSESRSVVSNSLRPYGLYIPWNSPGQNTRVGSHSLLPGIFPTQGSDPGLQHCRQILYQLSHKRSPTRKNWCFWNVVLQKTLASPLDSKEIKPVNLKGNQARLLIGRADAEAEAPILWPPNEKNQLIRKDADVGEIESRRRRSDRGWDGWIASPTNHQCTWVWENSEMARDREAWRAAVHGVAKSRHDIRDCKTDV